MVLEVLNARLAESSLRCCYQMQHQVLCNVRDLRHIIRKSQIILPPHISIQSTYGTAQTLYKEQRIIIYLFSSVRSFQFEDF